MTDRKKTAGTHLEVRICDLRLDVENPRLVDRHLTSTQIELANVLRMAHDVFQIAQSIVENSFFSSEPLLVVENPEEAGTYIVVEGNRRLSALMGLTSPEVREVFQEDKWDKLAERSPLAATDTVPTILHHKREDANPEIIHAHMPTIGKKPWSPFAQAKWIQKRISDGHSMEDVAASLYMATNLARSRYRDLAIADQAVELGVPAKQLANAYSLLTLSMSSTKLRSHVGAPAGSHVKIGESPIPSEKERELKELLQWVFGDEEHEPIIRDSRQISKLGTIVGTEVGLKALRDGDSLDQANERIKARGLDPKDRLMKRLTTAHSALSESMDDLSEYATDTQVRELIEDIEEVILGLQAITENTEE
jgi:hypothetical protein